jgi:hypothetical protein
MRNLTLASTLVFLTACEIGGPTPDPPILKVTSPQRGLIQDEIGGVVVTGTVLPNPTGAPVAKVVVNGERATIAADGSWTASLTVPHGATLIHTVATDAAGGIATDTRSIIAGERRESGSSIPAAIGASVSATAFSTISDIVTTLIKNTNLTQLIAAKNPVARSGDEQGPDCLYAQGFVDSVTISDAKVSLAPAAGGLQISARIDQPRIAGHTMHAVACASGSSTFTITANSVTIGGLLAIKTNGMMGLTTELTNPVVQMPGLDIKASGVPGAILDILPLEKIITAIAPLAVTTFVNPMLNDAVGALTGPQRLNVLGKVINLQVAPSQVAFDAAAGKFMLDTKFLIEGVQSPGFTYTPNGNAAMDSGEGLALSIADDLANDLLAQLTATGLLNLDLPSMPGGAFDGASVAATSPPMIAADGDDGRLRLILPDMMMSFKKGGAVVARAAINGRIDLAVLSVDNGRAISIDLGVPAIAFDSLDDETTQAMTFAGGDDDFKAAAQVGANDQRGSILDLLKNVPLPKVGGLTLSDASITGASGFVTVKATLKK